MKTLLRILIGIFATFLTLALVCVAAGLWLLDHDWISGRSQPTEQHMTLHMSTLSKDRDQLLKSFRSTLPRQVVELEALPESLRVPGVQFALLHSDHITLITYRSPDTSSGFRVWKSVMGQGFADRPTAISFVTRFSYCNDYPESPSNRLE